MEILNKKERLSALGLFLLLFLITTGIFITAIFFNYKLPLKENEVLKAENEKMLVQMNYQKKFSNEFENITKLIDSMQKNPERFTYIESTISNKLGELGKEIPQDTTGSKFYERVILNVQDLVSTKKITLKDNDSQSTITQLTNEKKELEKELKDLYLKIQLQAAGSN